MKILLVGALSWNPERVRSLHERGHQLWGLWSRSMAWDQGPYPAMADCIVPLEAGEAAAAIRSHAIECVYSLFQVYHWRLWGPPTHGVEHDVWTLLRGLMAERQRGTFDAPIVRHWGFDVHNIDPVITRAFDGQIFCNREKYDYWTTAVQNGGCGVDAFGKGTAPDLLDSDLPKLEFMNDDFAEPLSRAGGEVHTVCVGRPFGIDYLAAASRGIHVHIYGNNFDDVYRTLARGVSLRSAYRGRDLLRRFVHTSTRRCRRAEPGGPCARSRPGGYGSSPATTPRGRTSVRRCHGERSTTARRFPIASAPMCSRDCRRSAMRAAAITAMTSSCGWAPTSTSMAVATMRYARGWMTKFGRGRCRATCGARVPVTHSTRRSTRWSGCSKRRARVISHGRTASAPSSTRRAPT